MICIPLVSLNIRESEGRGRGRLFDVMNEWLSLPPLSRLIFFEGGLRQAKFHVVAQTQGYHLVCIWGSLVKFQGGGVVLKTMLWARVWIC